MKYVAGCGRPWRTGAVLAVCILAGLAGIAVIGRLTFDSVAPVVMAGMSLVLSGFIWALRPKELATQLFAVNGIGFALSLWSIGGFNATAEGAAVREWLMLGNSAGNQLFYLTLIALFLAYPVRIVPPVWAWGVAALSLPYAMLFGVHVLPRDERWLGLVELLAILGLIVTQWVRTRRRPRERAALMWLALAVLVGTALWSCLLAAELMGAPALTSGVIPLILFFPFYVALAMGVARFCLVELQDWTFRILFLTVATLLFVAIDAALVMGLGVGGAGATAAALLIVAFGYLPLRELVWRRFVQGKSLTPPQMFAHVLEIVFAPTPSGRRARWEDLLRGLFRPLTVETGDDVAEPVIIDDGLQLRVPAVADAPPLVLGMPREGRGLFSPSQLALVKQLVALLGTAAHSRDAYERGAAEERRRLAQDLHDDVGARLLSGLTVADERTRPILHAALGDIRAIAGGLMGRAAPLDSVLADIRHEGMRRLEAEGCEATWTLWPEDAPLVLVGYPAQKALASAVREAVSNIIRHARARQVEVGIALEADGLHVVIRDDGIGFPPAALGGEGGGLGLGGMTRRLCEMGGTVRFSNATEGGAEVAFRLDLS